MDHPSRSELLDAPRPSVPVRHPRRCRPIRPIVRRRIQSRRHLGDHDPARHARRWPTRTPNGGSERYGTSCWTGPSSGTNANSERCSSTTSTTTTSIALTDPSIRPRRATPTSSQPTPTDRSCSTRAAPDSSTNTAALPDQHPRRQSRPTARPCSTRPNDSDARQPPADPPGSRPLHPAEHQRCVDDGFPAPTRSCGLASMDAERVRRSRRRGSSFVPPSVVVTYGIHRLSNVAIRGSSSTINVAHRARRNESFV